MTEHVPTDLWKTTILDPEWFYLVLEIKINLTSTPSSPILVKLDPITWKSLITTCLKQFGGILAESIQYDILKLESKSYTKIKNDSLQIIDGTASIRTPMVDKSMFLNSIVVSILNLDGLGLDLPKGSTGLLSVVKSSPFLAGIALHLQLLGMILNKLIVVISTIFLFSISSVNAAVDPNWKPKISKNGFQHVKNIVYFDDSPSLLLLDEEVVYRSDNDGKSWVALELRHEDGSKIIPTDIYQVPYDNTLGFILTESSRQYYTKDQGSTWQYHDFEGITNPIMGEVQVNYANHDYVLFSLVQCEEDEWQTVCETSWYTSQDGLASPPVKVEKEGLSTCVFAKSNKYFTKGDDSQILCIAREHDSFGLPKSSTLVASSDFFKTIQTPSNSMLDKAEILSLTVTSSFIVLMVQSDRYTEVGYIDIFVSKDGIEFKKSYIEDSFRSWMVSILPSSKDSLHIEVYGLENTGDKSTAVYQSDSSGLFFDKTFSDIFINNFGMRGLTKVQEIDGVWIGAQNAGVDPKTHMNNAKSVITFNDGKTWDYLKLANDDTCKGDEECSVHIFSMTERNGAGKLVTGPTPGILVGMGNTGKFISHEAKDFKTFMSRDGGSTWFKIHDKTSVFAFGDLGNIIVTIPVSLDYFFSGDTDTLPSSFQYSFDQGATFKEVDLGLKLLPFYVMTTIDGSSQNLIIVGLDEDSKVYVTFAIDFSGGLERTCGKDDMEEWYARIDPTTSDPICVYGHREKFIRRKQSADCFVKQLYVDLEVIEEPCTCSFDDTECEFGFRKDSDDVCQPVMPVIAKEYCQGKNSDKKIKLTSSRMIPDNMCTTKNGYVIPKDDVEIDCKEALASVQLSKIKAKATPFNQRIANYIYLDTLMYDEQIPHETILVLTETNKLSISYDGGEKFVDPMVLLGDQGHFISVLTNKYFFDYVYVITDTNNIYISHDRARTFEKVNAPSDFNVFSASRMSFNKQDPSKFIWYGEIGCDNPLSPECQVEASYTIDGGETFTKLIDNVRSCRYVGSILDSDDYNVNEDEILCDQLDSSGSYFKLVSTTDYFKSAPKVLFDKIIGSTETGTFVIVAKLNDDNSLTAFVSVDGINFAEAKFPQNINVNKQTAYTILDVNSKQVFMHVTTNSDSDSEYGALLKSNYNGTLYAMSIDEVNRNQFAYVDFETVQGLEGISILNIVSNTEQVNSKGAPKELKTKITHNDGAEWGFIQPPAVDSQGNAYECKGKSLTDCSLNLHSYTERKDPTRDTYSSASAIGMMFAVGNVDKFLKPFEDPTTATFFTRDAGITWKEVKKGRYMWEYGDQGTILVLVSEEATNVIHYSLDEGETWEDYQFAESPVNVWDIGTVPSDTARKFVLFIRDDVTLYDNVIALDFRDVQQRQCYLDLDLTSRSDDFEYWTPKHPFQADNCLFGHEARYLRRKASSSDCYIGEAPLSKGYQQLRNCSCSRRDFECDFNFAIASDGTCKLISGLSPVNGEEICSKSNLDVTEWWEPTGYRKVPMSTCEGGLELGKWVSHPCPGKESDYDRKHHSGLHGGSLAVVILVPILVFIGAAGFVYDRGIRRNGGFARFGEIRLDDEEDLHLIEENTTDKIVNKIVTFGVYSFGAMVTARQKLATFLKRGIFSRFGDGRREGGYSRFSDSFNDRIIDDEDESLFRYNTDDDDAREIDSFLEHGITTDIGDEDDEDFEDFSNAQETGSAGDPSDFKIDDDGDGDLGSSPATASAKPQPPRPSLAYTSKLGEQPQPQSESGEVKDMDPDSETRAQVDKILTRRSIRMTVYQMFLIIFLGSSVLNIMREKNYLEEVDDAYTLLFNNYEELIESLEKRDGSVVIEDIEDKLKAVTNRFESLDLADKIAKFEGVRGLKKRVVEDAEITEKKSDLSILTEFL
ncbi:hypothetical protein CANARDRAFT_19780 [[Candida] arabinofermentans NRRL YB-2248]|uniref:VPS10 domain-containing protein n=1 Tax=[Candida] arabinofermentans NRRL YB-2248 TaxID=983967 RepID=A0A1E4SUS5_9ASCO|nr:hypothetical protein CANARDRAFT_19780 [[Candida] arabinofermentans NRRL YB-2248]